MTEQRSRYAKYRDRQRGGPPRKLKPHGSYAAYRRHLRNGETKDEVRTSCPACYQAWLNYQADIYQKKQKRGEETAP